MKQQQAESGGRRRETMATALQYVYSDRSEPDIPGDEQQAQKERERAKKLAAMPRELGIDTG